jgi:glycosyltransferase involved in cell wall biosynthesis
MVVGYNEAHLLNRCFSSLIFCDEIIYTDLGSSDSSLEIARNFETKIYQRTLAPSGEYIQSEIVHFTKNKWVIFLDPDEAIDPTLAEQIIREFNSISGRNEVGAVLVPWQFYFKKSKLNGTVWGGNNSKYLLVHKERFDFLPVTNYGRKIKEGFQTLIIKPDTHVANVLHH